MRNGHELWFCKRFACHSWLYMSCCMGRKTLILVKKAHILSSLVPGARRKVPLSEGSVEKDGSLMCGYHGWRWNGEGKAICIPQVRSQLTYECVLMKLFNSIFFLYMCMRACLCTESVSLLRLNVGIMPCSKYDMQT